MAFTLPVLLMLSAVRALAQPPRTTIRVEVTSDSAPVQDADVSANRKQAKAGPVGIAILAIEVDDVDAVVSKNGFLAMRTALDVDAVREWQLEVDLQSQIRHEDEISGWNCLGTG